MPAGLQTWLSTGELMLDTSRRTCRIMGYRQFNGGTTKPSTGGSGAQGSFTVSIPSQGGVLWSGIDKSSFQLPNYTGPGTTGEFLGVYPNTWVEGNTVYYTVGYGAAGSTFRVYYGLI